MPDPSPVGRMGGPFPEQPLDAHFLASEGFVENCGVDAGGVSSLSEAEGVVEDVG